MSSKKKHKKATEELVQTQVLNIDELRKVEKYEKKISKKPAGICALIGAIMILIGSGAQGYIIYSANQLARQQQLQNNISERHAEKEEEKEKTFIPGKSYLICQLSMQGNANGTNYVSTLTYSFMDSKLKTIKKELILDAIVGNPIGLTSMQNLYASYNGYLPINGTVPGYRIITGPRGNIGFFVVVDVDLALHNKTPMADNFNTNIQVSVDSPLDTEYDEVKEKIEKQNYTCNFTK